MSLDGLRSFHFHNAIIKCLTIESLEYCYLIPIVSKLADYWGDIKMICLCKIMARQVKEHLINANHLHFLLSSLFPNPKDILRTYESCRGLTGGQLQDGLIFEKKIPTLLKSIKKPSCPIWETDGPMLPGWEKRASSLAFSRSSYQDWSEMVGLIEQKNPKRRDRDKQEFEDLQLTHPNIQIYPPGSPTIHEPFAVDSEVNIQKTGSMEEEKSLLSNLHKLDKSLFQLLEDLIEIQGQKKKILNSMSRKDVYLVLLHILRDRKIWKAEQWYPFMYRLSLNSHQSPFLFYSPTEYFYVSKSFLSSKSRLEIQKDLRRKIDQLSRSFLQKSQSEKQMSRLIMILIKK